MEFYLSHVSLPELASLPVRKRTEVFDAVQAEMPALQRSKALNALGGAVSAACALPLWWFTSPAPSQFGLVAWLGGCFVVTSVIAQVLAVHFARPYIRDEVRGYCVRCGYLLKGNSSGVCPECGTPVPLWQR